MSIDTLSALAERTPLLTATEEVALATQIAAGLVWDDDDRKPVPKPGATPTQVAAARVAAEKFIAANLRLVYQAASARRDVVRDAAGLDFDDLVSRGIEVLIEHVYRFDPTRGYKFSSFAGGKNGPIARALNRQIYTTKNPVRLTHRVQALIAKARTYQDTVRSTEGREATLAEIAKHCGVPEDYLEAKLRDLPKGFRSIDTSHGLDHLPEANVRGSEDLCLQIEDTDPDPGDQVSADDGLRAVWVALDALPADVREVVSLRFGFVTGNPESLAAVAARLGISERQVGNLEQRGMAVLRDNGTLAGLL